MMGYGNEIGHFFLVIGCTMKADGGGTSGWGRAIWPAEIVCKCWRELLLIEHAKKS